MKLKYNAPVAEEIRELLAADLLDGSLDGNLESYGDAEDFTW